MRGQRQGFSTIKEEESGQDPASQLNGGSRVQSQVLAAAQFEAEEDQD